MCVRLAKTRGVHLGGFLVVFFLQIFFYNCLQKKLISDFGIVFTFAIFAIFMWFFFQDFKIVVAKKIM